MKVFTKRLKPWFKPFKKKAAADKQPPVLKLHPLPHNKLALYAERIGVGVCATDNGYATELAMQMMDVLYKFNHSYTEWMMTPNRGSRYELHDMLRETRNELCQCLNRIANHYMQTKKNYVKALTDVGFELTNHDALPNGNLPKLKERVKQK